MAATAEAPGKSVFVDLQLDGEPVEKFGMLEEDMKAYPKQALEAIQNVAERILNGRRLTRLIYLDDEGDACTLTSTSIDDALSFAADVDGTTSMLKITVLAAQPAPMQEVNPPTAPVEVLPPAEADTPPPPPVEMLPPLEASVCDEPVAAPAEPVSEQQAPQAAQADEAAPVFAASSLAAAAEAVACGVARTYAEKVEASVCLATASNRLRSSPSQGAAAFKTLAFNMDDELCIAALMALLEQPEERLRLAAVAAVTAALDTAAQQTPTRDEPQSSAAAAVEAAPELVEQPPAEEVFADAEEVAPATEEVAPATEELVFAKEEVVLATEEEVVETPSESSAKPSAAVVSSSQLVLGVEAAEDETARGDITKEFEETLAQLNVGASQAYRCGRVILPASPHDVQVPVETKMIVVNNGPVPWPEATCISIVHGNPFGLAALPLGAMEPGQAAEIIFDLTVPLQDEAGMMRSAWAMMDANTGMSFGPLIFFEAMWVKC